MHEVKNNQQAGQLPRRNFCTATNGKSAAGALVLYLVFMAGSEGKALAKTEERGFQCLCMRTRSKFIPPQGYSEWEVIAPLKRCRQVCLEPTAPCVQLTVKAILARARDDIKSTIKEKSRKNTSWSFSRK
ncbi:interleukin-8-like [Apus apus]|uniref:interleukin-8-like n=1 Tax=Apus apus TaxID=8895 RepID=UPI0021F8743B|nr:interleukin-8-like [Apus apus]